MKAQIPVPVTSIFSEINFMLILLKIDDESKSVARNLAVRSSALSTAKAIYFGIGVLID
jgi:hypothetical protein